MALYGFQGLFNKTANNEDNKPLPRFLTLWTNSKKAVWFMKCLCERS